MRCNIIKFNSNEVNEKYVSKIITDWDKLSVRSDEVEIKKETSEVQEIVLKLKNTIKANEGMVGLSAPQIGYLKRIMCVNFNGDIRTFINPLITNREGMQLSKESCHSLDNKEYIIPRFSKISVTYTTPMNKIETAQFIGLAAFVVQHQVEHLDGILLSDIGLEIDNDFNNASDKEKEEIINLYLQSLDFKNKEIELSIEEDEDAKKLKDSIRFIQSVETGETKITEVPWTEEQIEEYKKSLEENNDGK